MNRIIFEKKMHTAIPVCYFVRKKVPVWFDERQEVPVWHTVSYRPTSSTGGVSSFSRGEWGNIGHWGIPATLETGESITLTLWQ